MDVDPERLDHDIDQQPWRYRHPTESGRERTYSGYVTNAGGSEGARLRRKLADAVRSLLAWAAADTGTDTTTGNSSPEGKPDDDRADP
ncbi:hypothetical protein [Streptomyces aureoverticillatus]|uniref:hypothetical protein n=1 Tax=Streptomyces aureoverticillatus TaxID=66871 RepID=UPI0013DAD3E0|nr:hypothetical protein [Streptomyces aureoverticillatus]QIB45233.1 hypothetical protein G3H79_21340 [Streptomyces aureoverticillatus]